MLWFGDGNRPFSKRKIYLDGCYPAVAIDRKRVYVHRLIAMYTQRERFLPTTYCHHIDGNVLNASVANIKTMPSGEHSALHLSGKKLSDETRRKMSEAKMGHEVSVESRRRIGAAQKGKVLSRETRRKLSESLTGRTLSDEHRRKLSESHKGKVFTAEHRKHISEARRGEIESRCRP